PIAAAPHRSRLSNSIAAWHPRDYFPLSTYRPLSLRVSLLALYSVSSSRTISRPSREPAATINSRKLAGPCASTSAAERLPLPDLSLPDLPLLLATTGGVGTPHSSDCRLPNGMVQSKPI